MFPDVLHFVGKIITGFVGQARQFSNEIEVSLIIRFFGAASMLDTVISSMQYVYLLRCSDETIYVGCTSNIEERLKRHFNKEVQWTKDRLPVVLITYIAFTDKVKAFKFEKYLKSGSGRAFANKRLGNA